ncbi:hypothetical protein RchiOBHm_Chr5g0054851 [Rosa chinensis]|uniref:Uncharacterized protein n=1 Tax=Rosa chinensis TaxID=74649 RepID=A0A2P6QG83_ROSCH|nr:hypothetical protein RchiOBHm_Chr5g0054851 [Rosa chinensis]
MAFSLTSEPQFRRIPYIPSDLSLTNPIFIFPLLPLSRPDPIIPFLLLFLPPKPTHLQLSLSPFLPSHLFHPTSPRFSFLLTKISSPRSTSLKFNLLINSTNFKGGAQASRNSSPLNLGKRGEP